MERSIAASEFKAKCLALLDQVAESRTSYVITKHGRPVGRLVPLDDGAAPTMGSVTLLADDDEDYFTTEEAWEVDRRDADRPRG